MPSFSDFITRHQGEQGIFAEAFGMVRGEVSHAALSGIFVSSPRNAVPCRICEGTISKSERCFAWLSRSPRPLGAVTPGASRSPYNSTGSRWFIHLDCLLDAFSDLAKGQPNGCSFCGADVELEKVRRGERFYRVCDGCSRNFPMTCAVCTHRVGVKEASISLTPFDLDDMWGDNTGPNPTNKVVCDGCAESFNLDTVNRRRRQHREERREKETARQLAERVEGWLGNA